MNCTLHKSLLLQYFCQTCMDTVCSECIKSNPHSNQYHRISSIEQAVQNRKQIFSLFIENEINPLWLQIRQKLQQIKQIECQMLQQRTLIQKDVQLEFEAIQQRLRQKSEKKSLQCHTEIKYYQGYMNDLDDLVYAFDRMAADPYGFLLLYHDIHNRLKSLQLKEIKEKIDEFVVDGLDRRRIQQQCQNKQMDWGDGLARLVKQLGLPREFKTTQARLSTLTALNQRNHFLNDLISHACSQYQTRQNHLITQSSQKHKSQLRTFNNTNKSIISLNTCRSCVFCGFTFSIETLNDQCTQNKSIRSQPSKGYGHVVIEQEFKGTKRHYWVESAVEDRKVPDPNGHSLLKAKQKKQFLNSLRDLEIIKCCFRDYEIDHAIINIEQKTTKIDSFIKIFQTADKQKKGFLSKITFKYILTKTFQMDDIHCDVLTEILAYGWKMSTQTTQNEMKINAKNYSQNIQIGKIEANQCVNYMLLREFIKNPQFLYKEWEKVEEQMEKLKPIAPVSRDTNKYRPRY